MRSRRRAAGTTSGASIDEIEVVCRARYGAYLRVAVGIVGELELGRDAVQEAFATAIVRRGEFRSDGPIEAWLWRIVSNAALAVARRRREQPLPPEWVELVPSAGGAEGGQGEVVRALVAGLPERQRLVLFLHYYADLDYETIARVLGITEGTVAATLAAGRAKLHRLLEVPDGRC
ncbi:MAG: sigma-70 family RNA polymerase sigma factor [Thermoleophilia bacterium]